MLPSSAPSSSATIFSDDSMKRDMNLPTSEHFQKPPKVFLKLSFVLSAIHSTFLCGILHALQVHTEKALKVSGVSQRRRTGYENKVVQTGNKNLELFGYKDIQNPPLQCIYFQTY